jgi:uncharacterized Fe-S cluster protein YjdI
MAQLPSLKLRQSRIANGLHLAATYRLLTSHLLATYLMKDITKKYSNGEVTIVWQPGMCIHSGNCWRGLQEVFHPEQKPWITPEGSTTDKIIAQVNACPSGALSYFMNNAETQIQPQQKMTEETPEEITRIRIEVNPNGPLRVYSAMRVELPNGEVVIKETAASFCRCGNSKNKPFCDGNSHKEVGFVG